MVSPNERIRSKIALEECFVFFRKTKNLKSEVVFVFLFLNLLLAPFIVFL